MKIRHPRLLQLAPSLTAAIMHGVYITCRQTVMNLEVEEKLAAQGLPIIYTCWHGQLSYMFYHFRFRPRQTVLLASPSFDGEFIGRVAEKFGARLVYGSRNKGGLQALKQIATLLRQGKNAGIIADGSRGPYHTLQKGVVVLARDAQAAILPVAVASKRKIILNTWDRFELNLPFSQLTILFGEPLTVPPEARGKLLEEYRLTLETRLNDLFHLSRQYRFPD